MAGANCYNKGMKFFVIVGEKSGDKQGALVMQELMSRCPDIQFEGLGGNRMHALAPAVEDWADQAAARPPRTWDDVAEQMLQVYRSAIAE